MKIRNKQAARFNLTFEVITKESAKHGDFARHGYVPKTGNIPDRSYFPKNPHRFTLREAINVMSQHNSGHSPIEADSSHLSRFNPPRWLTVRGETDALGVSLHIPQNLSPSSAMRIARLLGCYGLRA